MRLFQSIATVSFYTIGSRIFGFLRTVIIASFLGTSAAADAVAIAIRVPSLLRRLLAEGAFTSAFVPLYAGLLSTQGRKQEAHHFASTLLSLLLLSLIVLTLLAEFFMPSILQLMVPGFSGERLSLTIQLTRITFPFIIFISLCAFYGGILNSFERFSAFSSSPMAGNLSIILTTLLGFHYMKIEYAFALSVLICGLVQFLWVYVPARRQGIRLRFSFPPTLTPELRQFGRRFAPAAAGSGVVQINIFIGSMIASLLPVGGVAILSYADRLIQLPLSVVGTAVGTVLLPLLSKQIRQGHLREARTNLQYAVEFALFFTLPAMAGLIALATPLVALLFEHGKFGPEQTLETAKVLTIFSLGLPAYVLIKVFSSSLFAQQDTKTPLIAAAVGLLSDVGLSLALLPLWQIKAIALATAVSAWINVGILSFVLYRRKLLLLNHTLILFNIRAFCVSIFTFLFLSQGQRVFSSCFDDSGIQQSIGLGFLALCGLFVFFAGSHFSGLMRFQDLRAKFQRSVPQVK